MSNTGVFHGQLSAVMNCKLTLVWRYKSTLMLALLLISITLPVDELLIILNYTFSLTSVGIVLTKPLPLTLNISEHTILKRRKTWHYLYFTH